MSKPYTARAFKDLTIGVGIPGFLVNDLSGNKMFVDANHGELLNEALRYCVRNYCDLILLEGFTDVLENAAYWRSTDETYYDFPNQRLNILRKWSSDPYPATFKVEAEACDYYEDAVTGNSGGQYRKGDLDVMKCDDQFEGWCVTEAQTGEWLRWVELPFRAGQSTIKLRYSSTKATQIRFDIDGVEGSVTELPSTGGAWQEVEAASVSFDTKGWREVVLNIVAGDDNLNLNYFTIVGAE